MESQHEHDPQSGARGQPRGIGDARAAEPRAGETQISFCRSASLRRFGKGCLSPQGPAKKERKLAFGGAPLRAVNTALFSRQLQKALDGAVFTQRS